MFVLVAVPPLLSCPSCVDLELSLFRCDICDGVGGPRNTKKMSLLKRWQAIRMLEKDGSRPISLFR